MTRASLLRFSAVVGLALALSSGADVPPTLSKEAPTTGAVHGALASQVGLAGPLSAYQASKTRRLLDLKYSCLGCHSLDGEGGRIGPALDGVGQRLDSSFVRRILEDPEAAMPGTVMPRPFLSESARESLVRFLVYSDGEPTGSAVASRAVGTTESGGSTALDGAGLYGRLCASCHGAEGRGDGPNAGNLPVPPTAHADASLMSKRPDDTLFDAIHAGAMVLDGSPRMPGFGLSLSGDQIRALVAHIRELCGCRGPSWSRDGTMAGGTHSRGVVGGS